MVVGCLWIVCVETCLLGVVYCSFFLIVVCSPSCVLCPLVLFGGCCMLLFGGWCLKCVVTSLRLVG